MHFLVRILIIVWSLGEMGRWSMQYRFVAVELFIKTESVTATHRGFRHQFPRPNALPQYSANVGIKVASRRVGEGL
jgi:hypothetical protein